MRIKSHWPRVVRTHRVSRMNMPGEPPNDRRAVPRHIRDGEHDSFEDTMAGVPAGGSGRSRLMWMLVAVALAGLAGAWFALR